MPLVPTDYPSRLAKAGLQVNVLDGWESRGGSADHRAVVFHWTASSSGESPSSCANYVFYGAQYAPDYNVLIDRVGCAWVGARLKSNSSGEISGTALDEAQRGKTNWASAASRGLSDTTSSNSSLFAISAQNNGTGEPWSEALKHGMAVAAAVALECLGLAHAGYVTHHSALTRRKIDLTEGTGGCPSGSEWQRRISDAMKGVKPPAPEPAYPWPGPQEGDPEMICVTVVDANNAVYLLAPGVKRHLNAEEWSSMQAAGWDAPKCNGRQRDVLFSLINMQATKTQ